MPELLNHLRKILRPLRAKAGYLRIEGSYRFSARWSRRAGTSKVKRNPELIVSLTTIPERIGKIHLCLDSLLRQSIKPDRIILWLGMRNGDEDFPFPQSALPRPLERMQKRGVEIRWCKDIRAFTKIIPPMRAFPEALIVTADDDMFYPREWLKQLFEAYKKEPQHIHCHRAHLMRYDSSGMPLPYREWDLLAQGVQGPSLDLFPTGYGGVLYAPGHLNSEVLNEASFLTLCPYNDDVWLKAMSLLNHVSCKKIGSDSPVFPRIRFANNRELQTFNLMGNGNDPQIEAVRRKYGTFMAKTSSARFNSCLDGPVPAGGNAHSFQEKAVSGEHLP
jgi:hypothetical protein